MGWNTVRFANTGYCFHSVSTKRTNHLFAGNASGDVEHGQEVTIISPLNFVVSFESSVNNH